MTLIIVEGQGNIYSTWVLLSKSIGITSNVLVLNHNRFMIKPIENADSVLEYNKSEQNLGNIICCDFPFFYSDIMQPVSTDYFSFYIDDILLHV